MINLRAFKSGASTSLDVLQEAKVQVKMAFADPGQLTSRTAPYSGTFALPFSDTNKIFFGHFEMLEADITTVFSPDQAYECVLEEDGVTIVEGKLQLRGADPIKRVYTVAVVGNAGDLIADMGNTPLYKVFEDDAIDYEYENNEENVRDSWLGQDITTGALGASVLKIPFADYGLASGGVYYGEGFDQGIFADNYLQPGQLFPALQVAHTFDKVMQYFGYNVTSDFFSEAAWTGLYFGLGSHLPLPVIRPFASFRAIITQMVGNGVTNDLPATLVNSFNYLVCDDSVTGGFDEDGQWTNTGSYWTAPATMTCTIRFRFGIDNTNATTAGYVNPFAQVNGVLDASGEDMVVYDPSTYQYFDGYIFQQDLELSVTEGDEVSFGLYWTPNNAGGVFPDVKAPSATIDPFVQFMSYQSDVTVADSGGANIGTVQPIEMLPQVTCADFVRDLVQRFNLTIVQQDTPTDIEIEPMSEYLFTGTVRDWSKYVHRGDSLKVSPLNSIRNKFIRFDDGVEADYPSSQHQQQFGFPLGQYAYESTDEFATGEANMGGIFSTFVTEKLPNAAGVPSANLIALPALYGVENGEVKRVTTKPKLGYIFVQTHGAPTIKVGTTPCGTTNQWSPFTDNIFNADTRSIYYRHQYVNSYVDVVTPGIVEEYWSDYLETIYSEQGKMLECELALRAGDLATFQFADEIVIDGSVYRCIELTYTLGAVALAKGKFLKRTDIDTIVQLFPGSGCDNELATQEADGTTTWTNPSGDTITDPGNTCCSAQGFVYDGTDCYWTFNTGPVLQDVVTGPSGIVLAPPPISVVQQGRDRGAQPILRGNFPSFGVGPELRTKEETLGVESLVKSFVLQCTTNGTDAVEALPFGESELKAYVATEFVLHLRIRAVGVIITGSNYGETGVFEQSVLVSGDDGTKRTARDQRKETDKDASFSNPTITTTFDNTTGRTSGSQALKVTVTGTADEVTAWTLYCEATYIDTRGAKQVGLSLFMENGDMMALEDSGLIEGG